VALALGIACFVWLLYRIGWQRIISDLGVIGWGVVVVIGLELAIDGLNALGWRYTFPPHERRIRFGELYLIRLAGTAFNQAVPSATIGGEPVKAMLLREHVPLSSAVASVVSAKLAYSVAQAVMAFIGFAVVFTRLHLPRAMMYALLAALVVTVAMIAVFFWLQRRGLFATATTLGRRLHLPHRWVDRMSRATSRLDRHIQELHAVRPFDFVAAVGCHLAGFVVGVGQIYLLLRWLNLPADLVRCVAIEGLSVLIQTATFLVPGSIGVQEGGKMLIFRALGLPASAGFSVGVVFRLTQLAGISLGLAAFALLQRRQPAPTAPPLAAEPGPEQATAASGPQR
jgi:putative membrane protein